MKRLVLGVIGHVDHGKTALVLALTGQDTDRLVEEKRRGISIALGFAHLRVGPDLDIDLIDMPGHEDFVRTMIAGATGLDAVLLIVAANEGIKPQTLEHVDIAGLLGIRRAVVAITKADLVTPDEAAAIAADAMNLLARSGLTAPAPILTSAPRGEGIEALRGALERVAADQTPPAVDGLAFLPIDRAFSIVGHGPVVTGTLRGASIAVGDTLELWPARRSVRVKSVQVNGVRVASAAPGRRVALNLRDVDIADLKRGMALAAPDTLEASDWLTLAIRAVDRAPPLKNGMRLRALMGTDEADVRLRLLDRDVLEPGESGFAQLHLKAPIALPAGEPVILRVASPAQTVAGGRLLEPGTRRLRRNGASVLERLEDLRALPPAEMIAAEVRRAGAAGTTLRQLSQLSALAGPRIAELLDPLPMLVAKSGLVVAKADFEALAARVPQRLARHADGLSQDQLQAKLPGVGAAVLDAAVSRLVSRTLVVRRGGRLFVPRPAEERARARDEAELADQIAERLRRGGLSPPDPKEIVTDLTSKRAVDRLLKNGVVVSAVDRAKGKEILFHQDAIAEARARLAPLLDQGGGLLVSEIAGALGVSRKYTMPLLDHLDTIRFTRRVDDRRTLGAASSAAK